jgi:hypothetical protein
MFLCGVILSCDPADNSLKIRNLSKNPVYVTYSNDSLPPSMPFCPKGNYLKENDTVTFYNCDSKVDVNTTKALFIRTFRAWGKFISNQCYDKRVRIFIYSESAITNTNWDSVRKYNLYLKRYELSLEDLKKNNWIVNYP